MAVFGLTVLALSAFLVAIYRIFHQFFRKIATINNVHGPRAYCPLGNIHQFKPQPDGEFVSRGFTDHICSWMLWKPFIIIYGADEVEPILGSQKHIEKGTGAYEFLHDWLGLGLLTSHADKWRPRRKLLTPTFHYDILKDFSEIFNQQAKILLRILEEQSRRGPFDICSYITHCALDIICESAMGRHVNAQNCKESDYVQAVYKMGDIIHDRSKRPVLWPDLIFRLFGRKKEQDRALAVLHGFTNKVIKERRDELMGNGPPRNEGKRRLAFLDLLLDMVDKGKLTMQDVREEVDTFMFEGHDTTSASMNWTLHLLGCSLKNQARVHEELDSVFGDDDRDVSNSDLKNLPFLECCIKEALRLYPSVPMYSRTLMEHVNIGHKIPEGVEVAINAYGVHRDPRYWKDPDVFNPQRFLPENMAGRHPFSYIPFSAGNRNCIGQRFGLMEEKTVLAWILRYFEIESVHRRDQIRPKGELILRPSQGVWLTMRPRRQLNNQ